MLSMKETQQTMAFTSVSVTTAGHQAAPTLRALKLPQGCSDPVGQALTQGMEGQLVSAPPCLSLPWEDLSLGLE